RLVVEAPAVIVRLGHAEELLRRHALQLPLPPRRECHRRARIVFAPVLRRAVPHRAHSLVQPHGRHAVLVGVLVARLDVVAEAALCEEPERVAHQPAARLHQRRIFRRVPLQVRRVVHAQRVEIVLQAVADEEPGRAAGGPDLPRLLAVEEDGFHLPLHHLHRRRVPQVLRADPRGLVPVVRHREERPHKVLEDDGLILVDDADAPANVQRPVAAAAHHLAAQRHHTTDGHSWHGPRGNRGAGVVTGWAVGAEGAGAREDGEAERAALGSEGRGAGGLW
uniref:Uncharacterized protein n=1 Tax=Triticum urartu TaxID=4572 RepID=A0A8R7RBL8_TRIUA